MKDLILKREVVPNVWHCVSKSSFTKVCADARLLEKMLFGRVKCSSKSAMM